MNETALFNELLHKCGLGSLTAPPRRVHGGYMHRMYRLDTASGAYAVKLMNPVIMDRQGALENYRRAESLERLLEENRIPIVAAMEINGAKLQRVGEQYMYVFPWIDGSAVGWDRITEYHCRAAGVILARIHKILRLEERCAVADISIDWKPYIIKAKSDCPALANALKDNLTLLVRAQDEYNAAAAALPDVVTITDGDMDSKNVMWVDERPLVIDLECLDFGNPMMDMFILALSWAGGAACDMDYARLKAFMRAYTHKYGSLDTDPKKLYGLGFIWLEWLEYNTKRALGIECADAEEQKLGHEEALATLKRIVYHDSIRDRLMANID